MRLCYILLSPTFGMHQYTADLANLMAQAGHDVRLVTTRGLPRDRYASDVQIHAPLTTQGTGFSPEGLRMASLARTLAAIRRQQPEVVHFTGVHLWNLPLVWALRRSGIPVVHTLHDLDPHYGRRFGNLIRFWNGLVLRSVSHVLVHGHRYRRQLIAQGYSRERITHTPLLHLCFSYEFARELRRHGNAAFRQPSVASRAPSSADQHQQPFALFFGRLERYKGVGELIAACAMLNDSTRDGLPLVLAGAGALEPLWPDRLPAGIEVRNRLIGDEEALDLFRRCGLLVLPYVDATQSALVAAAYFFGKPAVVTRTGALPEYVQHGRTGWVVEPGDPAALADALAIAGSDPAQLARMGAAGRAWYDEQRRLEGDTLEEMYVSMTDSRHRQQIGHHND